MDTVWFSPLNQMKANRSPVITRASPSHAAKGQSPAGLPAEDRRWAIVGSTPCSNEGLRCGCGEMLRRSNVRTSENRVNVIERSIVKFAETSTIDPMESFHAPRALLLLQMFVAMATQGHIVSEKVTTAHEPHDGGQRPLI